MRPAGASRTCPSPSSSRAPIARSAPRCIAIVRRAGKSPPGGASLARPRRASSGPSRSTEPRSRPDQAALGLVALDPRAPDAKRARPDPVDLGAEVDQQARHHLDVADARHVGEDALLVGEQARGDERQRGVLVAADDDAPDSGRPPSISSVDTGTLSSRAGTAGRRRSLTARGYHPEQPNLFAKRHAEPRQHLRRGSGR